MSTCSLCSKLHIEASFSGYIACHLCARRHLNLDKQTMDDIAYQCNTNGESGNVAPDKHHRDVHHLNQSLARLCNPLVFHMHRLTTLISQEISQGVQHRPSQSN